VLPWRLTAFHPIYELPFPTNSGSKGLAVSSDTRIATIMCKVTQYQFSCEHHLKLCKSRCRGTKEKKTRSSAKAACCAEPYIYIKLSFACSKCQQDFWLASWQGRLDRAIAFRDALREKEGLLGAVEVAGLVKELREEYASAAWDINKMFPHARNSNVGRVALKQGNKRQRMSSLLRNEVEPHLVVLPPEKEHGWIENDDDEEDFVRSTDPLHPICTDYSHPLDDVDDGWLSELFTAEELQTSAADNDFVIDHSFGHVWDWGDGVTIANNSAEANSVRLHETTDASDSTDLTAWGPNADPSSSPPFEIGLNGVPTEEEKKNTMIEEVIRAFWDFVNGDVNIDTQGQHLQHPNTSKPHLAPLLQAYP
jgi:hypothetical protein